MSDNQDPTQPTSNAEKFAPQNVADAGHDTVRPEGQMTDVPAGSEADRRRNSSHRVSDQG